MTGSRLRPRPRTGLTRRQIDDNPESPLGAIGGETGTGKEVIARLIHSGSCRAEQPFVAFNCTGLPRDTAESQLFGHRRGSFTDARDDAPGIIRGADGGTLMLDEIGELDPSIQPKLLRFLDSGEVQPVGEPRPVPVDVRVIAATNVVIDTITPYPVREIAGPHWTASSGMPGGGGSTCWSCGGWTTWDATCGTW